MTHLPSETPTKRVLFRDIRRNLIVAVFDESYRLGHEPAPSETPTEKVPFKDLIQEAKYKNLDRGQDVKRFWRNLIKEEFTTKNK